MSIDEDNKELSGEQPNKQPRNPADHLKSYQYKKGQSGNPNGRPKGISLKEYVKIKFSSMSDEEKEEYLEGIDKRTIWEMGEDKARQGMDVKANVTISDVLDSLEADGPTTKE